jgi:predicted DCC family thiol-disulfide oxidoreductase YuxK
VLVFNGVVVEGLLAAIVKPLLQWTKIAAAAERPIGVAIWKFGDAAANWMSRNLVSPPPPSAKPSEATATAARPLVLFDGVCLLCAGFVNFVLDHNADESITFAPLQSEVGKAVLTKAGLPLDVSTVVFIDDAGVHVRSTAALRVLSHCGMPYALLHYLFILLPRPLRDAGYRLVASVRYRLFGQDDGTQCRLMTKKLRARFLDKAATAKAD